MGMEVVVLEVGYTNTTRPRRHAQIVKAEMKVSGEVQAEA